MSASCEGVLIENLEACMQQGVATSPTTIGAPYNVQLPLKSQDSRVSQRKQMTWKDVISSTVFPYHDDKQWSQKIS